MVGNVLHNPIHKKIKTSINTQMSQKRIEFIDLAKGICIILIILGHCSLQFSIPGLTEFVMPAFFVLSGLFFKEYKDSKTFFVKKTNGIFVPFLFFYLTAYIVFYTLKFYAPQLLVTHAEGITDLFDNRQYFNGPIWFLISLFWSNIYLYIINRTVKKDYLRIAIVIFIGFIGWLLGQKGIIAPMFMDVALTTLPFFATGYYLKKTALIYPNKCDKYNLLFIIALWVPAFLLSQYTYIRISFHYNIIEGTFTYLASLIGTLLIVLICKRIKSLPFISYCGRYSLVLLCVHHMIYRPLMVLLPKTGIELLCNNWSIAIITLLLSALCIPVCKKLIPWFVAQKDLIKLPQKREKNVN